MLKRLFWLLIGVVLGIYLWRRLTRIAHSYTPDGLAERAQATASSTAEGLRAFAGEVRILAERRERELREAFAENTPAVQLPSERPRTLPAGHRPRRGDGRELRAHQRDAEARPASRHGD